MLAGAAKPDNERTMRWLSRSQVATIKALLKQGNSLNRSAFVNILIIFCTWLLKSSQGISLRTPMQPGNFISIQFKAMSEVVARLYKATSRPASTEVNKSTNTKAINMYCSRLEVWAVAVPYGPFHGGMSSVKKFHGMLMPPGNSPVSVSELVICAAKMSSWLGHIELIMRS